MSEALAPVLARWREALAWRQDPAAAAAAAAVWATHTRRPWPGFAAAPLVITDLPHVSWAELLIGAYADYDQLNADHFAGACPLVKINVNGRLRSVAGRVFPPQRLIELNAWRLAQVPESRVETVFHEMIHLWLYTHGLPMGHGPEFRAKMAERGHQHTRFGVEGDVSPERHLYPGHDRRVVYGCPHCGQEILRRRRYSRPMLCGSCYHGGRGQHVVVELGVRYV